MFSITVFPAHFKAHRYNLYTGLVRVPLNSEISPEAVRRAQTAAVLPHLLAVYSPGVREEGSAATPAAAAAGDNVDSVADSKEMIKQERKRKKREY